jgi:hypothetical protein
MNPRNEYPRNELAMILAKQARASRLQLTTFDEPREHCPCLKTLKLVIYLFLEF